MPASIDPLVFDAGVDQVRTGNRIDATAKLVRRVNGALEELQSTFIEHAKIVVQGWRSV